jgi:hypothetical protein
MKSEDLLHYIWQYQLFDKNQLTSDHDQSLSILKTGIRNSNSGPDFENSRVMIGALEWAGKVEIHIKSSDWEKHNHEKDEAYESVILHVVWQNDKPIKRKDGTEIPTLTLENRVEKSLLAKYQSLKENQLLIPCESFFHSQNNIAKVSMIEKALASRLERKSKEILELFDKTNRDFEEVAYRLLLRNFGFKLNAEPFLRLAQSLPIKTLSKHRDSLFQTEALLFGQAGFLEDPIDEYAEKLKKEYQFLAQKYDLADKKLSRSDWRFLRTRPQNFPTVRLAQVAGIITQTSGFFSTFIENEDSETIKASLQPAVSEYWLNHYDWAKTTAKPNTLGKESLDNILINTAAPLLAAYYYLTDDYGYFEQALELLEAIKPERNFITKIWDSLDLKCKSAFDSQALIEQYNEFCTHRKCLQCAVGVEVLKI